MPQTKLFTKLLEQAYLMEKKLAAVLKKQTDTITEYPDFHHRLLEHMGETELHAEKIAQLLRDRQADIPELKEKLAEMIGSMEAVFAEMGDTDAIKYFIADFTAENMEIAVYETILIVANELEDMDAIKVISEILEQEESMVGWLTDNQEKIVTDTFDTL